METNTFYNIQKHAKTLELPKVLELLAEQCSLEDSKKAAMELIPSSNFNEVIYLNRQTSDAYSLSARFSSPSFGSVTNVRSPLTRAEMGGLLTMAELLKIGELLRVCRTVKTWRENNGGEEENSLDELFSAITPNKFFEEKIFFCIKSEDEMSDNASAELADIRKKIRRASLNVRERLDKIIKGGSAKFLQESLVTQREGRFVVPVKAEHKGDVPGLVHDTSSSGATLFVEPMAVVEINNEIKVLQSREKDEIERILYELSGEAAVFAAAAKASYDVLLKLDLVFAKAALAFKMRAAAPKINNIGKIRLKNARHPLINPKQVVPVSLELGYDYNLLLITGPNTGGKTVTLKTIGLLTLMTQCGLMIPADDGSEIAVFSKVLSDIGDEQSIEQSLSTFSSHIKNIINILKISGSDSLVLLDELCAGTDPVEGAALAESILETLLQNGAVTASTTHYAELKTYALERQGAQNACCEFDVETLRPTYRLLIGVPGRSNAFEISKKLGLPDKIVEYAGSLVSGDNKRFDAIVGQLEKAHTDAEKERETAARLRGQLEQSKKSADQRLKEINLEKDRIIEKARQQAEQMVDYARSESNRLLNELEELKAEMNRENTSAMVLKARGLIKKSIGGMEKNSDSGVKTDTDFDDYVLPRALRPGDRLRVRGFQKEATLIKQDKDKLTVSLGNMRTTVGVKDVMLILGDAPKSKNTRTVSGIKSRAEREVKRELDIRGLSADEALIEVDRFLDAAVLAGSETVTIIHGKGTGVLREAVRRHLKSAKNVKAQRPGVFGEGEDGVTVVTLK